jgi:chromosome segregation ATPase
MDNLKSFKEFNINEAEVTDDKLAAEIEEFAELAEQITKAKAELTAAEKKYKLLEATIAPVIEGLDETEAQILEVKNIIVKIRQKGYKQDKYKYAQGYKWLKERVNAKMKKIIEESLEATKGTTEVATKLEATRTKEENVSEAIDLTAILDRLKGTFKSLFGGISKNIKKFNSELKNSISTFKQTI